MKPENNQWRSLAELAGAPAVEAAPIDESIDDDLSDPPSRRHFMQLMGASMALAGLAGCRRWEKEEIVPEAQRPEGYVPGVPKRYASSMELGGAAIGVLVTAYDGRPIKVEGNPQHPYLGGGSTVFAQASVLEMYDPDRSTALVKRSGGQASSATWADFEAEVATWSPSTRLRVLAEASSSPTLHGWRKRLLERFPQARWHEWEPLSRDNERLGAKIAFGRPARPVYELSKAKVIVTLDADAFVDHPAALGHARGFAATRRPENGELSRLYAIEAAFSSTGAAADHRLPLRSELVLPFLMALDQRLNGGAAPEAVFLRDAKVAAFIDAIAGDVKTSPGGAIFIVGAGQPPAAHALAAKLNAPAQSAGAVKYVDVPDPERPSHLESITTLAGEMKGGSIDVLLILGGNPAWNTPADLGFAELLPKVAKSVHLSLYQDETSALCSWHLPRAHYLESWGDAVSADGTYGVVQPVIEPLYGGKTPLELLATVLGRRVKNGMPLVRETFDALTGNAGELEWRRTLQDGFLATTVYPDLSPSVQNLPPITLEGRQTADLKRSNGELEVVFATSPRTYDGRFANLAWLQELPEYLSKLTWDNAAFIGPRTASDPDIGVRTAVHSQSGEPHFDMVKIEVDGRSVTMPAYVLPGIAPYTVVVALGHGRSRAGRVAGSDAAGVKSVGFDAYPIRSTKGLWSAGGARLSRTGSTFVLASTQDHWAIDPRGRKSLVERVADLARDFNPVTGEFPGAFEHEEATPDPKRGLALFEEHTYDGYKWGMATDLGLCIGCNACVVACQAENNIPTVGKARVLRSREMHWLRIDTYFRGDVDDPQVVHQPLTCQQCENAPCEQVCPVGATVHSDEGLNDMSYNRCVGTRYCMNNCIYKVRRFNFFNYQTEMQDPRNRVRKLLFNPEVTVRSRGVMEKCTFCVQRIQNVKIQATNDGRRVRDGEIQTACQQACPTGAIVFGDLNDKNALVTKLHAQKRAYEMLGEFYAKPRNLYLGRVRNLNPKLARS